MKKNLFYLLSLIMVMAVSVCVVSCGDDDDNGGGGNSTASIVGEWGVENGESYMVYSFESNRTGSIYGYVNGRSFDYDMTWKLTGNNLVVTFSDGSYSEFTVKTLTATKLVLIDEDGDTISLTRWTDDDDDDVVSPVVNPSGSDALYGVWVGVVDDSNGMIFGFGNNGQGILGLVQNGVSTEVNFTYTYNSSTGRLVIRLEGSTETLTFTVVSVSGTRLVLRDENGNVATFTRYEGDDSRVTRAAGVQVGTKDVVKLTNHLVIR